MEWTAPAYAEIKMDAEIGSYQEDHEPSYEPQFVETEQADLASAPAAL
jgi:hypothetical protein